MSLGKMLDYASRQPVPERNLGLQIAALVSKATMGFDPGEIELLQGLLGRSILPTAELELHRLWGISEDKQTGNL
jgi:hypothetical protein